MIFLQKIISIIFNYVKNIAANQVMDGWVLMIFLFDCEYNNHYYFDGCLTVGWWYTPLKHLRTRRYLYSSVAKRQARIPGISATAKAIYTWVSDIGTVGTLLSLKILNSSFTTFHCFAKNVEYLVTRCNINSD